MTTFDQLCATLENSTHEEMDALLTSCFERVMPALKTLGVNGADGIQLLISFMLASCYADGAVNQEEYELMHAVLQALLGDDLTVNDAKHMVDSFAGDQDKLKAGTDKLIDMLGELDPQSKMDAVTVCLIVCAVDHKITEKEKAYVKQLVE